MRVYAPSGRTHSQSLAALFGSALIGALVVGVLTGVITHWFDLIILFAILMGSGAGWFVKAGVKLGHCRNAEFALLAALIAGFLCYGLRLYTNYRLFRSEIPKQFRERVREDIQKAIKKGSIPKPGDPAAMETLINGFIVELLKKQNLTGMDDLVDGIITDGGGRPGFFGWCNMVLRRGISISPHGRGDGLNLGYYGSLILLLAEIALAMYFATTVGASQVDEPYCEKCFQWAEPAWERSIPSEELEGLAADLDTEPESLTAAQGLLADIPPGPVSGPRGKLVLVHCKGCRDGYLSAFAVVPTSDGKGESEAGVFRNCVLSRKTIELMLTPSPDAPDTDGDSEHDHEVGDVSINPPLLG